MNMTTAYTIQAKVTGAQQIKGLTSGLQKVEGQSVRTAGAMGRLKMAAGGAMVALKAMLPVLGIAALGRMAKGNLDVADSMSKMSQRTGIAAPMLDKFRKVAELSDTSIKSLGRAFPALAKGMDDALNKGTGPAYEAFQRLGVAVTGADGTLRASDAVMLEVADKLKAMHSRAPLAAYLMMSEIQ